MISPQRARCSPSTARPTLLTTATCPSGGCWSPPTTAPSGPAGRSRCRRRASPSPPAPRLGTSRCGPASTPSRPATAAPSSSGWSRTGTRSTSASPWSGCCRREPSEALARRRRGRHRMRLTEARPGTRVLAFGGYQPARVLTNDELAATVDTTDEWIRSRVGIASRRIAGPDESLADMATAAGGKALAASGLSPGDIDLVIVATCTPEAQIPNTAAQVARRLGINAPGAYDMNAACAGFCYALASASDAVRTGTASNVLLIGAEKLSQWIDWTDRSTCIIFADGAGAVVVGPVTDPAEAGIGPVVWGSAGDMADKIYIPDRNGFIIQEGQA